MSTKTPNDGSLQTTKQMLDELDALMERMLSLPVNDGEPGQAATETPVVSANLTLLKPGEVPSEKNQAESAPVESDPEPARPPWNPPHFARPAAAAKKPAPMPGPHLAPPRPDPEPLTNDIAVPSTLATLDPLLADMSESATGGTVVWCYFPLLWINQRFDSMVKILPGSGWLRSPGGRMFLGVAGLALTVTAFGWLVKDWLGWNWR